MKKRKKLKMWWMNFKSWKCMTCLFLFPSDTFWHSSRKKKYVQNTSYNTQILRAFRFFWWKNVGVSLSKKHSLKDSTNVLMYKVFLFASTKYLYGFLLNGLNVFICILRGNFVFLFVRYSFCALQNTVACISALFHIFTASQVC